MVSILTLSRTGGTYTDTLFGAKSNPSVVLMVTKWLWKFKDVELAIDEAEVNSSSEPNTIAGGFKRITIEHVVDAYLDAKPSGSDDVQTKLEKLWNIAEYGNPAYTYGVYRGNSLYGLSSPTEGQLKVTLLEMEENARLSEPARNISGSISEPNRIQVKLSLRKMKRSI